jgi:hypothetical protein
LIAKRGDLLIALGQLTPKIGYRFVSPGDDSPSNLSKRTLLRSRDNRRTDYICSTTQGIRVKVRVALRRRGLGVTQQFADDGEAHACAHTNRCKVVPEIVKPKWRLSVAPV